MPKFRVQAKNALKQAVNNLPLIGKSATLNRKVTNPSIRPLPSLPDANNDSLKMMDNSNGGSAENFTSGTDKMSTLQVNNFFFVFIIKCIYASK